MKIKDGVIISEANGTFYLVDSGISGKRFNGMIKLNETGAEIARLLMNETTREAVTESLCAKYNISEETASENSDKIIDSLDGIGLIDHGNL